MTLAEKAVARELAVLSGVEDWLNIDGVTGLDVGFIRTENGLTRELGLRVHVQQKRDPDVVPEGELFNVSGQRRNRVDGVPIDVIEAEFVPQAATDPLESLGATARFPLLAGGISVGNTRNVAGTIGAIVWRNSDGRACLLSNRHVLAASGAEPGEPIYQPAASDGGTEADVVATLLDGPGYDAGFDAALCLLNDSRPFTQDVLRIGPITGVAAPALGLRVIKSGQATNVTRGIVDGIGGLYTLALDNQWVTFRDQIHIIPREPWPQVPYELSAAGDSGSAWLREDTREVVGLHIAGELGDKVEWEMAMANRMDVIAAGLDVSFVPPVPGTTRLTANQQPLDDLLRDTLRRLLQRMLELAP